MDLFIFKMLRGAAIISYLVAFIAGVVVAFGLFGITSDVVGGAVSDATAPQLTSILVLAIAWTVIPTAIGFSLDRLARIGTAQRD